MGGNRVTQTPTARRRQLGRELRKARNALKMTQKQVGALLKCTQSKITKIELDLVEIDPGELELMLVAYKLPEEKAQQLRELAVGNDIPRLAPGAPPRTDAFKELVDRECEARQITGWHSERIPGPLQSEQYMLKQFKLNDPDSGRYVTRLMNDRLARAQVVNAEEPPRYRVVLSESSLHRMPGGRTPNLVLDQVNYLQRLIERHERLEVQVLTYEADIAFVDNDFQVLNFADEAENFAYVEYPGGARTVPDTGPFDEHWNRLSAAALNRDDTAAFLDRLASENEKLMTFQ